MAELNLAMLNRAEEEGSKSKSIMDTIHTLKIYNPPIGDKPDPEKAMKFKLVEKDTGEESFFDGPVTFNILDVAFFYSGSLYPIQEDGGFAEDKMFFYTNEFGKYTKNEDTVGLATMGKPIGFFKKGDFQKFLICPMLNGKPNQFYDQKKDKDGKPYASSHISKRAVVYGKFLSGPRTDEYFKYYISMGAVGSTFKDGETVPAPEGTLEDAISKGLDRMNVILVANNRKKVQSISPSQIDVRVTIVQNDRQNFLPKFETILLAAERGIDNAVDIEFIKNLKQKHFSDIFGDMIAPTPILIQGTNATLTLAPLPEKKGAQSQLELAPASQQAVVEDEVLEAKAVFGADELPNVHTSDVPF